MYRALFFSKLSKKSSVAAIHKLLTQFYFCAHISATSGGLSDWSDWSTCVSSVKGDPDNCSGVSERTRECDNPAPQHGGFYCHGMVREIKPCNRCRSSMLAFLTR